MENPSRVPTTGDNGESATIDAEAILGLNHVFKALSHPRRRYLLYTLIQNGNEERLTDLAAKIAAWEADIPVDEVADAERDRVYVSLYHNHIPKLAENDILDYDEGDETIVRATNTEQVEVVLSGAGASEDTAQESHAE